MAALGEEPVYCRRDAYTTRRAASCVRSGGSLLVPRSPTPATPVLLPTEIFLAVDEVAVEYAVENDQ